MEYAEIEKQKNAKKVITLSDDNKNLIRVLEFYANEENFKCICPSGDKLVSLIEIDNGKKARSIIEKIKNRSKLYE